MQKQQVRLFGFCQLSELLDTEEVEFGDGFFLSTVLCLIVGFLHLDFSFEFFLNW